MITWSWRQSAGSALIALIHLACGSIAAADQRALTPGDYARAERYTSYNTAALILHSIDFLTWLPDGRMAYRTRGADGVDFFLVDPKSGVRNSLLNKERLATTLSVATGHKYVGSRLPFDSFALSDDGRLIVFEINADGWSCTTVGSQCQRATSMKPSFTLSPDKRSAAYIRDQNLWIRDLTSGVDTPLTSDGIKDFGYATDDPGFHHSDRPIIAWSPDSTKIATFQADQRGVADMFLVRTKVGHPELEAWKYPMPGDAVVTKIRRVIVDVNKKHVVALKIPTDPYRQSGFSPAMDSGDGILADAQWSADGATLAFISTSRDHKLVQLRIANATSGDVRTALTERALHFFSSHLEGFGDARAVNWRYLSATQEFIWLSSRDDWNHLYLYDARTGVLKRRITSGSWNVSEVLRVDEQRREVYFLGVGREPGRNPYFAHLYKVNMDDGRTRLLTPEDANHEVTFSPVGSFFLDRYSTPQLPPIAVLRDQDGKLVFNLEQADIGQLRAIGWTPPTPLEVKARDGMTDLYGLMFRPSTFDKHRRYPIINWIYPGPNMGSIANWSFSTSAGSDTRGSPQALAELGFIVVAINGMGTPPRSLTFRDTYYGNLGDNSLPDQVAAMTELGRRFEWIDLGRIGIIGHSGGGYAAADAMFRYPEVFKVGVAMSGNHDQRGFTDQWGEKYIGLLRTAKDGSTNYDSQSNAALAKNLKGHLLLMHGLLDDDVPPYLTLEVVEALIQANKDFDLLLLPSQGHLYSGRDQLYAVRRSWDYFVRYLADEEPPKEFRLGAATSAMDAALDSEENRK